MHSKWFTGYKKYFSSSSRRYSYFLLIRIMYVCIFISSIFIRFDKSSSKRNLSIYTYTCMDLCSYTSLMALLKFLWRTIFFPHANVPYYAHSLPPIDYSSSLWIKVGFAQMTYGELLLKSTEIQWKIWLHDPTHAYTHKRTHTQIFGILTALRYIGFIWQIYYQHTWIHSTTTHKYEHLCPHIHTYEHHICCMILLRLPTPPICG